AFGSATLPTSRGCPPKIIGARVGNAPIRARSLRDLCALCASVVSQLQFLCGPPRLCASAVSLARGPPPSLFPRPRFALVRVVPVGVPATQEHQRPGAQVEDGEERAPALELAHVHPLVGPR